MRRSSRPRFPREESRSDGLFCELQMRQQIAGEVVQGGDHPRAGGRVVLLPQRLRAVFDLVEQMRYPPVIGLQLVYHRAKLRIRAPDGREERRVLNPVVRMYDPAIVQAVDP